MPPKSTIQMAVPRGMARGSSTCQIYSSTKPKCLNITTCHKSHADHVWPTARSGTQVASPEALSTLVTYCLQRCCGARRSTQSHEAEYFIEDDLTWKMDSSTSIALLGMPKRCMVHSSLSWSTVLSTPQNHTQRRAIQVLPQTHMAAVKQPYART